MPQLSESPFDTTASRMKVHPYGGPEGGIDVTETVVRAIGDELGQRYGGNTVLNQLEAEQLLADCLDRIASHGSSRRER